MGLSSLDPVAYRVIGSEGMPVYHFMFTDRTHTIPDIEGVELPDLPAAFEHAVEDARFLVEKRMLGLGYKQWERWRVEVTDDAGRQVLAAPFSQVMD